MNTCLIELNGIKYKNFVNDDMARSSVAVGKPWEPHLTQFVQLYEAKTIVDIGANFGYHTLLFSKQATVYAFEPQSQNYQLLLDNIELNNITNVIPYNFACGDTNCYVKMPIIDTKSNVNMGDITPDFVSSNYTTTKSIVLDEMDLPQIDLIKIDVQGWEKKVLIGSRNILATWKPALIVEFEGFQLAKTNTTCKELFDYIREQNYYIFYLDHQYPSDHVCIHNDKLAEFREKFKDYIFEHHADNWINNNVQNGVTEKIVF